MRNNAIEIIATSYMVQNRTTDLLDRNDYTYEDFTGDSREIIKFIENHRKEYGEVPEESTVLYEFGDKYSRTVVSESPLYIEDTLRTHITYNKISNVLASNQSKLSGNSKEFNEAVAELVETIESEQSRQKSRVVGTDLTKNKDRMEEYAKRIRGEGEDSYDLGIPSLDEALGGILADDLITVYARPGVGKSYTMTYMASQLHKQGLNILFYSGEMEESQVGYRFDSMRSGVSNSALLAGRLLPQGTPGFPDYAHYIEGLSEVPNYFTVVTPRSDFNGNLPTVRDFEKLIDEMNPDVLFVDQLSLVKDHEKARDKREQYTNIMRDLRTLSGVKRVPIFLAAQANREASAKNEEGEFEIPELHHLAESDAIGQFSTRVIGVASKPTEDRRIQILKLGIKKNRHSFLTDMQLLVDFDLGEIEETMPEEDNVIIEADVPF